MKRLLVGVLVGLLVGGGVVHAVSPRQRACNEVLWLEYVNHDRAFAALQDLLGSPRRPMAAALWLQRIDDSWVEFNRLAQRCLHDVHGRGDQ